MQNFFLTIKMGNASMLDEIDVSSALSRIEKKLLRGETSGIIMDSDGNRVGDFGFKDTD